MALFQDNRPLVLRLKVLQAIFCGFILLLIGRTWQLSILDFEHYDKLARNNRIRTVPLIAPRGLIRDRDGRILADNTHAAKLLLYREDIEDRQSTLEFLAAGLNVDISDVEKTIAEADNVGPFQPIHIRSNLSIEEVAFFMSRRSNHPEIRITQEPRRIYPYGDLAAHVLGYIGEVTEKQLSTTEFRDAERGDLVGKYGVERSYNPSLTGQDGAISVLVDSRGRPIEEVPRTEPVAGEELQLTLDLDLQQAAEEALGDRAGAVVALDPRSGEVLAMASRPTFDPNSFSLGIPEEEWQRLITDPGAPFHNKAIQSALPPGSTFKVFLAQAGLEEGLIDPGTRIFCKGWTNYYGRVFRCNRASGHGSLSVREAIQRSCNVFFYELGQRLGIDRITTISRRFGLGRKSGLDLHGEAEGIAPSRKWKRAHKGEPWYEGDTISISIGQGLIAMTPHQIARAFGILARGNSPAPHLLKGRQPPPSEREGRAPDPEVSRLVREGMWRAVNNWGTARAALVKGFDVCGKTGTAQLIGRKTREKLADPEDAQFADNAWFAGFAPRDDAEIVVVVIVQRGGSGGAQAAPIAGRVFDKYYQKFHKFKGKMNP